MAQNDPFEDAKPAALYPSMDLLNGRLMLVKPVKLTENIPSSRYKNQDGSPVLSDRIDADITVVDGPLDGFDTTEFRRMYVSGSYQVTQLRPVLERGATLLGRLGLKDPNKPKGQGNPWGFVSPTEDDKQIARDYLAGRTVTAAAPARNPFG